MRAYLDNNATTPAAPEVRAKLDELMALGPLNPGSSHRTGQRARELFENAKTQILLTLGLPRRRIVFCGSATEAINLAIRGTCGASKPPVALSSFEHPAVSQTVASVAQPRTVIVNREGLLDVAALPAALDGAKLACFMYANNETGAILPLGQVGEACRKARVPFLLDACQAPGKTDFLAGIKAADPDMLVFSSHKMHAPTGIAALVLRDDITLPRQLTGGGQQYGMRASTEPVVLAQGLATALTLATTQTNTASLESKTSRLWAAIRSVAPHAERTVSEPARRLANTLHYRVPGLSSERQVIALDLAGVEVSAAAACESGGVEPSKVMLGMGFDKQAATEGIRVSVSRYTSDSEVDFACGVFGEVLKRLLRA